MIRIHLDVAVGLYLGISIAVLVLWVFAESRKKLALAVGRPDALRECPVCYHCYIDSRSDAISACPQCGALHRRGEKRVQ